MCAHGQSYAPMGTWMLCWHWCAIIRHSLNAAWCWCTLRQVLNAIGISTQINMVHLDTWLALALFLVNDKWKNVPAKHCPLKEKRGVVNQETLTSSSLQCKKNFSPSDTPPWSLQLTLFTFIENFFFTSLWQIVAWGQQGHSQRKAQGKRFHNLFIAW